MRISDLSHATGVPVPTIKFYLREGILPFGRGIATNQAEYGEDHVRRLRLIRALAEVGGLPLATVRDVLGAVDDPKLPAEAIDLVLMVDVYHEFSQPQRMLQRIRESLKPGGRLVLVEYRAEDPDVPILPDHKMTKAQVKLEVEHEGFEQTRVHDDLPRQHLIIFTKP